MKLLEGKRNKTTTAAVVQVQGLGKEIKVKTINKEYQV